MKKMLNLFDWLLACLPVKYCPSGDVHVQSGEPIRRENRHSKCNVVPGYTPNSPPGSIDAEPDGIFIKIVGGASSLNTNNN